MSVFRDNSVFMRAVNKIMNNVTIRAIQQGYILLIALAVVSGFSYLILSIPIPAYQDFLAGPASWLIKEPLSILETVLNSYGAMMLVITISYSFSTLWKLPAGNAVILPLASLVVFIISQQIVGNAMVEIDTSWTFGHSFSAVLFAVLTCHVYRFFLLRTIPIGNRMFPVVLNPYLTTAVYAIPTFVLTMGTILMCHRFVLCLTGNVPLQMAVSQSASSVFAAIDSEALRTAAYMLVSATFSFLGISGEDVLFDIHNQYFHYMEAFGSAGVNIHNVIATDSFLKFSYMGGMGAILPLTLAILFFSNNKIFLSTAKLALLPVIFNMPSILVFGIPVICNPAFAIPFLFLPLLDLLIVYLCMYVGAVPLISHDVSWTIPAPIYGYLATDSWQGGVLQMLLIVGNTFCYLPFMRLYERLSAGEFSKQFKSFEEYYRYMESGTQPLVLNDLSEKQLRVFFVLVRDLEEAIYKRKLFMVYQPQFKADGTFLGAEALLRWDHPLAGFLYPPMIISIAKLGDYLPALEEFIFQESCRGIKKMNENLEGTYKISVNITGESLAYDELEDNLDRAVRMAGIDPKQLWIEITEQDALAGTEENIERLHRLKKKGHKLLIDDFGMGHTSVAYLMTNQFDVVKLDGSITRDVIENTNSQHIVRSLTQLSKDMGLMVIAEFVDNVPQRNKLIELGCEIFQGYLYSKPVSMDEMLKLVKSGKAKEIGKQVSEDVSDSKEKEQ
ncbi:MAG TPA: hypothetical protein DEP57_07680 [Selenomonas sp.]|nr:hypothetical protein [Selenomonas sp.]